MVLKKFMNKSFVERLLSGIVLVLIALITIIAGGDVLLVTVGIISLIGLFEMNRVFSIEKDIIGVMGYLCAVLYYILIRQHMLEYEFVLFIVFVVLLMALYVFKFPKVKTESVMASLFGVIYVAAMLSFIYLVRTADNGLYNVWLIFLCSWGSDTCAYVFGVAFGKHKMSPVLSPKKSVEGAVGGVLGAALLGFIYASVFKNEITGVVDPRIAYPVVIAVGSLIAMTGDLAASAIKRNHNIKDYGKLIPGHGGIMDRFDSVIFVAPVIWLLLNFVQ
ncbi:MAG: phosphatidate cytidylyltransferase [Lachnospiraceae bacterium]|nr:phosphatidate cytidylyltransferase [Lachnospiraceae bacterium]